MFMQIDERTSSDGKVEILWNPANDETVVRVESKEYGVFDIPTSKALAHDTFIHPFAMRNPNTGWQQCDGYAIKAA